VVRWWAAFFIAGIASPPGTGTGLLAAILISALGFGAAAAARRSPRTPFDRFGTRRVDRAPASFVVCCAAGLVLWQAAGLESAMRSRSSTGAPRSIRESRGTTGAEPSERRRPAGLRALSLPGVRSELLDALDDGRLSRRARGLVGAIVLGERSGVGFTLSDAYSYVGLAHLLALSGMHLGAIAVPLSWLLSRLIRSRRRSDFALLVVLGVYASVACFPASLLRALFLTAAIVGFRSAGMNTDLLGALVAGSGLLVAIDPSIACDAGFQLSFAAVCAIALIAAPLAKSAEAILPDGFRGTILKAVLFPALVTCSVQLFTLPLVVHLFYRTSILAPVVNVIVSIPFAAFLYAGALYVFVPLAALRTLLALGMNPLCAFLEAAPAAFAARPHAGIYRSDVRFDAYLCGTALIAWALRRRCPRRRAIMAAGAAFVVLAFMFPSARMGDSGAAENSGVDYRVTRVSWRGAEYVGAGTGIVFLGDDFGSGEAYRFTRALWAKGVSRVGRCVVAPERLRRNHGLFYLLSRVRVDEVLCSRYLLLQSADLAARVGSRGARIAAVGAGDVIREGRWRLEITGPPFPPPRGTLSGADAVLTWRLIAVRTTSLDLPPDRGYHAVP
jgi:ComEC/Rec2-related protein